MIEYLIFLIAVVKLFVKADSLDRLLFCPISDQNDYYFLQDLISNGLQLDIFEEKVDLFSPTVLRVLTNDEAAPILIEKANCFEEKSSRAGCILNSKIKTTYHLGSRFHDDYRSYQNTVDQLYEFKNRFPQKVKFVGSIGKSHEDRDLTVIHISAPSNELGTKPLIWVMSGQHAREWIGPAATMFVIDQLLNNPISEDLLKHFEFAILPLVNPDGYEFSRTVDRMWRKNRRPGGSVDLNRNWDVLWGQVNASNDPKSISYSGPNAASEPEIKSTQDYILSLRNREIGFDVHSYGQLVLRNYGYTKEKNTPLEYLNKPLSEKVALKMSDAHGKFYKPLLSSELYACSGAADDWLYIKAGIPGYTIELRDKGRHGFVLPKEQIRQTGEELFAGIVAASEQLRNSIQ